MKMVEILGKIGIIVAIVGFILFIASPLFINALTQKANNIAEEAFDVTMDAEQSYEEEINEALENDYVVYLDGEEVDSSKIDVSLYSSSIDHEKKVIFLTQKQSNIRKANNSWMWLLPFLMK